MSSLTLTIRAWRDERGLTQDELARAAGVRRATISGLETGQTRRVDLDTIEAIARALAVDPRELFEWTRARRTG